MSWTAVNGATSAPASPASTFALVAVSAGDLIVVTHGAGGNNSSIAVTDSLGNSYTRLGYLFDATNSQYSAWFAAIANGAGTPTCTFTGNGGSFASMVAEIYRPSVGTATLDQFGNSLMQVSSSTTPTSPSATPTANGALILGFTQNLDDATLFAPGGSFVEDRETAGFGSGSSSQIQHFEQSTAASIASTWTISPSHRCICSIATFTEAVSTPPAGDAGPTLIKLIGNRQTW